MSLLSRFRSARSRKLKREASHLRTVAKRAEEQLNSFKSTRLNEPPANLVNPKGKLVSITREDLPRLRERANKFQAKAEQLDALNQGVSRKQARAAYKEKAK